MFTLDLQSVELILVNKKSLTVEEKNGWKGEVDINSILGSASTEKFDRLINEYHNIHDSGIFLV